MSPRHRALALFVLFACAGRTESARGEGSVWQDAANPSRAEEAAAAQRAARLHGRYVLALSSAGSHDRAAELLLEEREWLHRHEAERSEYAPLLQAVARVERTLHSGDGDLSHLESAAAALSRGLATSPALPVARRTSMLFDLAVCHAHLSRRHEELLTYDALLAIEPDDSARSLVLANQADALMSEGRLADAVRAYRHALGLLPSVAHGGGGVTTLWGLAVALDRSGDLERALEHVALARTYDPIDAHLRSPSWFFVPKYEEHWYDALGAWTVARTTEDRLPRAAAYERAIASYRAYLLAAAPDDRWRHLAEARLARCESEARKEAHSRRSTLVAPKPPM